MNRNPLPYPPQLRNGGLLPAHLPSSSLLLVLLEALFGRQFSWWRVTFFLSSFLMVLLVDSYMVHCPSFASFAYCPFGSLCPSPIFFFHFMATLGIVGGCWYIAVDTLSTLGSLFSSISIPPYLVIRDSGTWGDWQKKTLAVRGLEERFSSCAVMLVFGSGGK